MSKSSKLRGTLVRAGTVDGQPKLIIHATEEQIRQFVPFPLYIDAEITFTWPDSESPKPEDAR